MKRFTRILVVLACLTLLMTTLNLTALAEDEKITIRWWNRNSGAGGPYYEFFKAFNASQDKIEVIYEGYGENYLNMLNLALNSDDPPDVFEITNMAAPVCDFAKAGYIACLDDILTDDFKAQFNSNAFTIKTFSYDGGTYCIPCRLQHYKLLYNKDIFEECGLTHAPETLEELREYAKIITEKGAGKYYGVGFYGNYAQTWLRYVDMFNIARGKTGMYGFDYLTGKFDFSTQKDMLNYWIDIAKDGSMFPGAMTMGVEQMRANFAQGNIGMMLDGNWMSTQFAMNIPTTIHWDAAPLPIFEGEKRAKDYMYCDVSFAVAAKGKHVDTAKEVYKIFMENQMQFRSFGSSDTSTFTAANEPDAMAMLPKDYTYQGLDEMSNVSNNACFKIEPHRIISLEGDNRDAVLNTLFVAALDGANPDVDAALNDLTERYNAALDRAVADGLLTQEDIKPEGFDYFTR